jgi:hypothetical protein
MRPQPFAKLPNRLIYNDFYLKKAGMQAATT